MQNSYPYEGCRAEEVCEANKLMLGLLISLMRGDLNKNWHRLEKDTLPKEQGYLVQHMYIYLYLAAGHGAAQLPLGH